MQTREQVLPWRKKLEGTAETSGGSEKTIEKLKLNYS